MGLMNAALFYGPGDVRFERIPIPTPGPGEVLLKIEAALTCGTDIKTYQRGHPTLIKKTPSTFGHELSGTIVEVGAGVTRFRPGMRVVPANSAPCFTCFYCASGQPHLCEDLLMVNGAYAEYMAIPARIVEHNLLELPPDLSFQEAALCEPLACAVHGADRSGIKLGDTVVVIGSGPLGLMLARLAHLRGARTILLGKGEERLAQGRRLGVDETIDIAGGGDRVQAVRALTPGGRGADVVIEAVGRPEVWQEAVLMARKGGLAVLFGGCKSGTTITVDTGLLHYSEVKLEGVYHHTPNTFRRALSLLASRRVDGREFIRATLPLSQLLEAFGRVKALEGIKYAIDPTVM